MEICEVDHALIDVGLCRSSGGPTAFDYKQIDGTQTLEEPCGSSPPDPMRRKAVVVEAEFGSQCFVMFCKQCGGDAREQERCVWRRREKDRSQRKNEGVFDRHRMG